MKYFKKLLATALLCVSTLGLTSFSANAVLISHDIILNGSINLGSVTVEVDDTDLNTGLIDVFDFVELNLLGGTVFDVFDFEAVIDTDNISAGIEFLYFDVTELAFADMWAYQVQYDAFDDTMNWADIFNLDANLVFFTQDVALSMPPTLVSEPNIALLFLTAGLAMFVRRKRAL